jgi:hypothetical protein
MKLFTTVFHFPELHGVANFQIALSICFAESPTANKRTNILKGNGSLAVCELSTTPFVFLGIPMLLAPCLFSNLHSRACNRMRSFFPRLIHITVCIGVQVGLIGRQVGLFIGGQVGLIGGQVGLIGRQVGLIGGQVGLIGRQVSLIGARR